MYKLIVMISVAISVILFVRSTFGWRWLKRSNAMADLKKQIDYLVWVILALTGCAIVYSIAKLILS